MKTWNLWKFQIPLSFNLWWKIFLIQSNENLRFNTSSIFGGKNIGNFNFHYHSILGGNLLLNSQMKNIDHFKFHYHSRTIIIIFQCLVEVIVYLNCQMKTWNYHSIFGGNFLLNSQIKNIDHFKFHHHHLSMFGRSYCLIELSDEDLKLSFNLWWKFLVK